jgi:hypothetical protein
MSADVPETENPDTLDHMAGEGLAQAPAEPGPPDALPELAGEVPSLSDLVIADRDRERQRDPCGDAAAPTA